MCPSSDQTGGVYAGRVLGRSRLSDRKAELEQLTTNARRPPKHILRAHASDQRLQPGVDWRPASQVLGFPASIAAETRAMPASQRLGPDDCHCLHDQWKPPIQLEEKQAISLFVNWIRTRIWQKANIGFYLSRDAALEPRAICRAGLSALVVARRKIV